jgi:hypothetical protein
MKLMIKDQMVLSGGKESSKYEETWRYDQVFMDTCNTLSHPTLRMLKRIKITQIKLKKIQ